MDPVVPSQWCESLWPEGWPQDKRVIFMPPFKIFLTFILHCSRNSRVKVRLQRGKPFIMYGIYPTDTIPTKLVSQASVIPQAWEIISMSSCFSLNNRKKQFFSPIQWEERGTRAMRLSLGKEPEPVGYCQPQPHDIYSWEK